ncbi:unannotated protein [freshwater metagenome]|uniref:Unannotated protein n=1 Tax=freshwater metagenome TaxID=449393 RepID=A0A6J6ZS61_9ZZZZ
MPYAMRPSTGISAAADDTFTIDPPPARAMCGAASRIAMSGAVALTFMMRS